MVEKRTCDYTGEEIEPGTGTMYVRTDGTILHFKDSKAEKNFLLGRESRDLEWTEAGRRNRGGATTREAADEPAGTADEAAESQEVDEEAVPDEEAEETEEEDEDVDAETVESAEADPGDDVDNEAADEQENTGGEEEQ